MKSIKIRSKIYEVRAGTYTPEKARKAGIRLNKTRVSDLTIYLLSGGVHLWAGYVSLDIKEDK